MLFICLPATRSFPLGRRTATLGYSPTISLEEGIRRSVAGLKDAQTLKR
jgi:nucleoside-diphosphate-sugar epimerase